MSNILIPKKYVKVLKDTMDTEQMMFATGDDSAKSAAEANRAFCEYATSHEEGEHAVVMDA